MGGGAGRGGGDNNPARTTRVWPDKKGRVKGCEAKLWVRSQKLNRIRGRARQEREGRKQMMRSRKGAGTETGEGGESAFMTS